MISSKSVLHPHYPGLEKINFSGTVVLLDPHGPNWVATDETGAGILCLFDGNRTVNQVVHAYAANTGFEVAKAWQHVETIARDALRHKFLAGSPMDLPSYNGREEHLKSGKLTELWIHTNNSCNLTCGHCLVSSGPDGDKGLSTPLLQDIITQAGSLGVRRFFFTGGEPFLRKDILEIIDHVLRVPEARLVILTNGILLRGSLLKELKKRDRDRLLLQISLDGSTSEVNDRIRGSGSFDRIIRGIAESVALGMQVTVTTVIMKENLHDIPAVTAIVGKLGGRRHHLLWLHKRGRALEATVDPAPPVENVIEVIRKTQEAGLSVGVMVDNGEALKVRLRSPTGTKWDMSNAAVSSLCVYPDGNVYPSAAMVNVSELLCGNIREASLEKIWRESEVSGMFRKATVKDKEICRECPIRFVCGGGDIEHSWFYGGNILAHDPYCELHKAMIADVLHDLSKERRALVSNGKSGYNAPVIFTGMGEGGSCPSVKGEEREEEGAAAVRMTSSECVLSLEIDSGRGMVQEFYGEAAETPQEELCCPVQPDTEDLSHIPDEVVERFYGCGSPVGIADIREGETTLDLGCGAGIDVFIAAKKVGAGGKAIGVDMTEGMLKVAAEARPEVAGNLGYDVVEFRKGYLESIPAEDQSVDLVTSNCVINLSPDKKLVFSEIWRVLKDHSRMVISDIISEDEVPVHYCKDPRLWGECISGALTEEEFMSYLERAGFYGLQVLRKSFWKDVEGYRFYSITVRGYKFEKKEGCVYIGQTAIYQGPFKGVSDEEGHWFPRGVPVEVCTDTASKLSKLPYSGMFIVTDPARPLQEAYSCCNDAGCC